MAGGYSGLATGLERGFRLGGMADIGRIRRDEAEREEKKVARDERRRAVLGKAFSAGQPHTRPGVSADGQMQPDESNFIGQMDSAVGTLFEAITDPENADIAPELLNDVEALQATSGRLGKQMHAELVRKATPHMKTLQTGTPEERGRAFGQVLTELLPDGYTYEGRFENGSFGYKRSDGFEQTLKPGEAEQMLQAGLASPEGMLKIFDASIAERKAALTKQEERDYNRTLKADDRAYSAEQKEADRRYAERQKAGDRAYTEGRDATKESKEAGKSINAHIAKGILEARKAGIETGQPLSPEAEGQLRSRLKTEAEEIYLGKASDDGNPTAGAAGEVIDRPVGPPMGEGKPKPTAAVPVPLPGGASPAGLEQRPIRAPAAGVEIAQRDVGGAISEVASDVGRQFARMGGAVQAGIPTGLEQTQRTVASLRQALQSGQPLSHGMALEIKQIAGQPDEALIAAGLTPEEVMALRQIAQQIGPR